MSSTNSRTTNLPKLTDPEAASALFEAVRAVAEQSFFAMAEPSDDRSFGVAAVHVAGASGERPVRCLHGPRSRGSHAGTAARARSGRRVLEHGLRRVADARRGRPDVLAEPPVGRTRDEAGRSR